jgi:hypothetical protein
MDAEGGDIYPRQLDWPELLLVDARKAEAIKDMHRKDRHFDCFSSRRMGRLRRRAML